MSPIELPAYPRIWSFVLALMVLIPAWVVALHLWIRPDAITPGRTDLRWGLALYLAPPILVMGAMYGAWCGLVAHRRGKARQDYQISVQEIERQRQEEDTRAAKEREDHQLTLEVIGLGLSVEKFRQQGVWQAIEQSGGAFILPTDPKSYAWSTEEKGDQSSKRGDDAFEHAASYFTEKWLVPGFSVTASIHRPIPNDTDNYIKGSPDDLRQGAGMAWHKFANVDYLYDDAPEGFFERVFRFFDENPDVPAAVLWVEDGMGDREVLRPKESPHLMVDGYRKPTDMSESMVAFVLARRDRLEAIRASVLDVPLKEYPFPDDPMPEHLLSSSHKPFWEHPKPFRPTKWLPRPWCKEQVEQFDSLPVLGYIHRPQAASFVHEGKPLSSQGHREAFQKAWQDALDTLPHGQEPARVIYDCGHLKQAGRIVPLVQVLHDSGSSLDPHGRNGVDLTRALGETGATSFFVGMALGVYASHEHKDPTAVVSFRRSDRATVVMIEPPTAADVRKAHPSGADPLNVPVVPYEP